MEKIKVLQIITKADWAGAQRVVYEICKYVYENNNNEIQMDVAVGDNGILVKKLESFGIRVLVLKNLKRSINPFTDIKGYLEIKKIIKNDRYDIVHCHSTKAGILGRYAANRLKTSKIIYTFHGLWPIFQYSGIKRKLALLVERYMASKTTDLIFISKKDIKISSELKLIKSPAYKLIYNSINMPDIKKGGLRAELKINDDIKIIGNVARVDKPKNPLLFIEIAREYFSEKPDSPCIFVWIGDGSLIGEAKEKIAKYNLSDRVFFIGFRENGDQYLADFNLLLMTSEFEGVPITILEAIELNTPVLSSDVGGIREIIGKKNVFKLEDPCSNIVKRMNFVRNVNCKLPSKNMANEYVELYKN